MVARGAYQVPANDCFVFSESAETLNLFSEFEGAELVDLSSVPPSEMSHPLEVEISLISTVRNALSEDEDSVEKFFSGISSQTLKPSEVVICDGGSEDGTWEALKAKKLLFAL